MPPKVNQLIPSSLKQWAYNASRFNQYGLHRDDCMYDETPEVVEALRRLEIVDKPQLDLRNFRIIRALHLDMQKRILPKEQWTKLEDDKLYLTPLVEEVLSEMKEKEKWDAE